MVSSRTWAGLAAVVVGVAVMWITNHVGAWWATAVVGGVIGLGWRGAGTKIVLSVLTGGLGWVLPLLWQARTVSVGEASSVLAGMMGFGVTDGWVVWLLTILFGVLLCAAAAWLGSAIRGLWYPARRSEY
ncbi:hypothetical protein [Alicyclobacillus cycloheptanicus]|uniref:Na+/citrate or Na+/malate symporter n=2 Tax=Alicyclobacillus cycloheptanicus TaxID=1457 RepID=A0ABT9XHJ8_9BACL|nr:hypothetical protein [Alicyclobacillus cycloheptanicus]MDQ0189765.1 Na+/citrate or Na+/malate symporter [Alicyclobacillus cycloheptanicus]